MSTAAGEVKTGEEIKSLEKIITEGFRRSQNIAGKDIVLVIGDSGVGKSTLITYLLGAEMVDTKIYGAKRLVPKIPDSKYPVLGHKPASQTVYPEVFLAQDSEKNPHYLCDTPGFGGNESVDINIASTVNMEFAIKAANSIRVVVLMDQRKLENKENNSHLAIFKLLGKIFKDPKKASSAFLWVFVRQDEKTSAKDILQQIRDQEGGMELPRKPTAELIKS